MIGIAISVLDYDPETGVFRWKADVGKKRLIGTVAGTRHPHGYVRITLGRKNYYAHRLAWAFVHGEWPKGRLDHRDGNPDNNRIDNLRLATHAQNMANQKLRRDNTTGYRGVFRHQGGFYAAVQIDGRKIYSHRYATADEAAREYARLSKLHHGEFGRPA